MSFWGFDIIEYLHFLHLVGCDGIGIIACTMWWSCWQITFQISDNFVNEKLKKNIEILHHNPNY